MRAAADIDRFKRWLTETKLPQDGRLPPERTLAERFGLTRSQIRKILASLEAEDLIGVTSAGALLSTSAVFPRQNRTSAE